MIALCVVKVAPHNWVITTTDMREKYEQREPVQLSGISQASSKAIKLLDERSIT